jgi:hypothetical protein
VFRYGQLCVPVATCLDIRLELGIAVDFRVVILLVWVESRGVSGDVDGVRAMEVSGAQWYGRRISYPDVQERRGGQYAIFGGRVCYCIPAYVVLALLPTSWKLPRRVETVQPTTYRTTSPTLTLPVWCSSSIFMARLCSASNCFRDCVPHRKYDGSGRVLPSSGVCAS